MKYNVGDLIVPNEVPGVLYKIISFHMNEYQIEVVHRKGSESYNTGTVFWHNIDLVDQKSRFASKLEKTLL